MRVCIIVAVFVITIIGQVCAKTIGYTGYIATDNVQYNWIDISQTGTEVLSDAQCRDSAHVPFFGNIDFSFYDEEVYSMYIMTSGVICLYVNRGLGCGPEKLPYQDYELIAPYWSALGTCDLWGPWSLDNAVYYQVLGQQPSRQMIVQWHNVTKEWDPENSGSISFQVILYEDSNEIKFQYKDVDFENDANHSNGTYASVGIQGPVWSATEALQWSYMESVLSDEYAILFRPVPIPQPVPLTVDYVADVNVCAGAEVFGDGSSGSDFNCDFNSVNNDFIFADTYAQAYGDMWTPEGPEPTTLTVQMGGAGGCNNSGSSEGVEFNTDMYFETQTESGSWPCSTSASGEGEIRLTGEIIIGSSAQLPAGHTCLKAYATVEEWEWENSNAQMKFWQNDYNEPLALLQSGHSTEFAIAAGSTLYFQYKNNGSISISDSPEYWSTALSRAGINFVPVILAGDCDINGTLNFSDYAVIAQWWLNTGCCEPNWCDGADLDRNGSVEWEDLQGLLYNWLIK